jgi:hypothetical protein
MALQNNVVCQSTAIVEGERCVACVRACACACVCCEKHGHFLSPLLTLTASATRLNCIRALSLPTCGQSQRSLQARVHRLLLFSRMYKLLASEVLAHKLLFPLARTCSCGWKSARAAVSAHLCAHTHSYTHSHIKYTF